MPQSTLSLQEASAKDTLVAAIGWARRLRGLRGDELIARHDAAQGRVDDARARDSLASQIASLHGGSVAAFCQRVKADVPSAKPCRMQGLPHPEGMRDSHARTELRGWNISHWDWSRLCAVAGSLDHEVVVTLRPRASVG